MNDIANETQSTLIKIYRFGSLQYTNILDMDMESHKVCRIFGTKPWTNQVSVHVEISWNEPRKYWKKMYVKIVYSKTTLQWRHIIAMASNTIGNFIQLLV